MHLIVQVLSDFCCDVFFLKSTFKNDGLPKSLAVPAYQEQIMGVTYLFQQAGGKNGCNMSFGK